MIFTIGAKPAFSAVIMVLALWADSALAQSSDRVARIVDAYGGGAALARVQQIEAEWVGYSIARYQSRHADAPYDRLPVRNWSAFDFATERSVVDSIGNYPGELNFGTRAINDGSRRLTLNTIAGLYVEGGMYSHSGMAASAKNRMPWMLVRDMAAHPEQFAPAARRLHRGIVYDVLRHAETDILVHPETSLIYGVFSRGENMTDVEIDVARTYTHYFKHEGVMINRRHQVWNNDDVVTDLELHNVDFNRPIDAHLAIPEGFVRVKTLDGYDGDDAMIRPLGGGAFLAGAGETRILYVEFDDHFVAVEAGDMPEYTEATYNAMRRHMGDKPLRYIIPTHHHDDHAAAIHFYSRAGAAVLTTRDKEGFMRRLLSRAWGDHPPVLDARFRFIDVSRLVLEDKKNRLEIYVVPDAPHSENMLVAYLPSREFLYTCDIFIGWAGEARQGASYGARHLARWVAARQADKSIGPIRKYGTCHGRPYSAAEFGRMIGAERTIVTLPGNESWPSATWFRRYGLGDDTIGVPRRETVIKNPALQ
jgi:glyoxylase-like metal-dependent hydrolase (beta-lactamase superfamily II)